MDQAAEYRSRISEIKQRGGGGSRWRVSGQVKEEVAEWARGLLSGGFTMEAIAREIGVSSSTLKRWLNSGEEVDGFRRVKLSEPAGGSRSGEISIVSPRGYRLEGLGLAEAIEVFHRL